MMNTYTGDTHPVSQAGEAPLVTPIGDLRRLDAPQRIATPPAFELEPLASLGVPTWTETPIRPLAATREQARPTRPTPDYVQPIGPVVRAASGGRSRLERWGRAADRCRSNGRDRRRTFSRARRSACGAP